MVRLQVKEICPSSRVFRDDGQVLRDAIEAAWSDEAPVEVDFDGETIASVSFLDQGIATLFVDHAADDIGRRLTIVGLTEPDSRLVNELVAKRRAQRTAA